MEEIYYISVPVFVLGMATELWFGFRSGRQNYTKQDTIASLSMGIGSLIVGAAMVGFKLFLLGAAFAVSPWPMSADSPWTWFWAILGVDFFYYWNHRFGHRIRFFWASHVVHHSSTHYNLSTALRQTWTGNPIDIFFYIPLALLGVPPLVILASYALNLLYQFWVHTEHIDRLGWFGLLFNTPSHHRVHHSSEDIYIDKNYAGILIIWDRMFGTFQPEVRRPIYGLTKNINSYNPLYIAFHEWIDMGRDIWQIKGLGKKLRAVYAPPETIPGLRSPQSG